MHGTCSTKNVELVRSLGADKVIDHTKEDFTRDDKTYDVVFDAVGKSSFQRVTSSLSQRGVYLTTVPPVADFLQLVWTSIAGGKKVKFSATGMRSVRKKAKDLVFIKEIIEAGKLKAVIDRRYPLEQTADAHRYVEKGHKKGNVVIIVEHNNKS